ncbi:hypothetical protein [Actinomadura rupiterrae]|uniref:hypothetical protein n=1 Tax=Actinomadura rupiterrae TaxID=559627 RepID=UPI0020A577CC|nr:hypothetical protein [Actinomadura rupiterrae]MCP2334999.1 ATP synthase protein I [Actinomadura rupiterrae]
MHTSDARMLRGAAIPSAAAGVIAIALGALLAGAKGAFGAGLGMVTVLVFFSISVVAVSYASRVSAQLMFAAAVFSYIGKLLVMLALIAAFSDATAWNPRAFAFTVVGLTVVWLGAEIRATLKAKQLYVDPAPAADQNVRTPADRSP